jgi:hypothetical protein
MENEECSPEKKSSAQLVEPIEADGSVIREMNVTCQAAAFSAIFPVCRQK